MFFRYAYFNDDLEYDIPEEIDHEKLLDDVPEGDKIELTIKNLQQVIGKRFTDALIYQMKGDTIPLLKDPGTPGVFSVKCLFTQEDYDYLVELGYTDFCKILYKFYDRLAFDEETGELYDIDDSEAPSYLWYMYAIKVNPNDLEV